MDKLREKVTKRAKEKPFLPDEIITNILIWLPVKSVVRFGVVCRKWRDMILARDFVDLHQRSSIPVILVATESSNLDYVQDYDHFAIDKWWDLARTRSMIHRFPFRDAYLQQVSHAGLIVLKLCDFWDKEFMILDPATVSHGKFMILNPARPSDKCVQISTPDFRSGDNICAVYYHPLLKEYCALLKICISKPEQIKYKLLSLGPNPSLKTIPFIYTIKDKNANPLFINNHLYWMLKSEQEDKFGGRNGILEFDIISEEFQVIPCPIPLNSECEKHQTHLLNSDGVISFLLILPTTITIWKLEDHVEHLWKTTEYTISTDICNDINEVGIIAFVDGKLVFESRRGRRRRRLYVCNLMDGTVKKYPERKYVSFLSHQMSLASLKDCTSALCIKGDDKVLKE